MIHSVKIEDTTWPVDMMTDDEDGAQWVQRYGYASRVLSQRMSVASVLSAYAHLTDPNLTMKDATAALRRARKAALSKGAENE